MRSHKPGHALLPIARASIANALGHNLKVDDNAAWLHEYGACFVTLTQAGELRGCIGSLEARRPLIADVKANAVASAFHDSRFAPVCSHELDHINVEVSLLSPMQALSFSGEADALAQLRPGIDGVVFEFERHRSTFLPQVWDQLPNARDFLEHLKRKAGLPSSFWSTEVRLHRYTVDKWREADLAGQPNTPSAAMRAS